MDKKLLTLCLIHHDNKLLLGLKKRGFGAGYWNGFGGKVQPHESIEQAAVRELQEEAGLVFQDGYRCGVLNFAFAGDPVPWQVHVFAVKKYSGEPTETEEMRPQWFSTAAIPYSQMWADDLHWLPLFLAGKHFEGNFFFRDTTTLVRHHIAVLEQN